MWALPTGMDLNGNVITLEQVLARPHRMSALATVEDGAGAQLYFGLPIAGGSVTIDREAAYRRQCRVTVHPYGLQGTNTADAASAVEALLPEKPGDMLTPYGNVLKLWRAVLLPRHTGFFGDEFAYFPLGAFKLSDADIDDDGVPVLSIVGYDYSRTIARNKLTVPWIVGAGTNYGDAIVALCQDRLPGLLFNPHAVQDTTPQIIVDPQADPWQTVSEWGDAIGHEVYFDAGGLLTIAAEPDPTKDPVVWTYTDGLAGGNAVLLGVNRRFTDDPGYNGVIMTSESNTLAVPIRSEAWDNDPDSPTYSQGQYGKVPKFVSNPLIATQAQGDVAAKAELLKVLGGTEQLSFAAIPNPAHEAGDVVRTIRPLARVDQVGVMQSLTMPLEPNAAMTINVRTRRNAE